MALLGRAVALPLRRLVASAKGALGPLIQPHYRNRQTLALRYLRGDGLEVGALHRPLRIPRAARVRYVDRLPLSALSEQYPELHGQIVAPDIVDDGETLAAVPDFSVDFLVANHVIEHMQDPIQTLLRWTRVLRSGGVLFLAVPDKRCTFDRVRPVTTVEHLERDHREGPQVSRLAHYREFAELPGHAPRGDVEAHFQTLLATDYSIHFHVWTKEAFLEFIESCRTSHGLGLRVEEVRQAGREFVVVLRRDS